MDITLAIEIAILILVLVLSVVVVTTIAIGPLAILFAKFGLPALRRSYLRPFADAIPIRIAILSMFVSSCVFALGIVYFIFRLRSSTAGIWFFFVPIYSLVIGAVFGLVTWALSVLFIWGTGKAKLKARHQKLYVIISVTVIFAAAVVFVDLAYSARLAAKAANPSASQEELKDLFRHQRARLDRYVMAALAANVACPPEVLLELARTDTAEFRERDSTLRDLIRNDFRSVLEHVASNPNAPPEALVLLAKNQSHYVVRAVARNPRTPKSVLVELSGTDDWVILSAIARNPSTPTEILERLSRDPRNQIRMSVAFNPSTPTDVLQKLATDADDNISVPAKDNLKKSQIKGVRH